MALLHSEPLHAQRVPDLLICAQDAINTYLGFALQVMVCLEPALAASGPISLQPKEPWIAQQKLSVQHQSQSR